MKVGLYFGSFNPIHTGHLIIASHVANYTDMDQVWFVVSPQNPLKPSSVLLNEYHRLFLVQLAVEEDPRLRATDVEFKLPRPSYTIDTLTYLQEKYPAFYEKAFCGADALRSHITARIVLVEDEEISKFFTVRGGGVRLVEHRAKVVEVGLRGGALCKRAGFPAGDEFSKR